MVEIHLQSRRVVWKFTLGITEANVFSMASGARVVLSGLDPASGLPAIWVENDPDAPQVDRCFTIYGTGSDIRGDGGFPFDLHVGSVIDGPIVWHIYERRSA